MRNYFTFGGIDSRNYGVYISGSGRLNIPERAYELVSVPGKMGAVPIDGKRIENAELTYPAFIVPSFGGYGSLDAAVGAFRTALLNTSGYASLSDSYDTTHYRKAVFIGDIDVEPTSKLDVAEFELVFNVDPRRFVTLGTIAVTAGVTKQLSLAEFPADKMNLEPIITVTGTGTITFTDGVNTLKTIAVTYNPGTITINSQLKECYTATGDSANGWVQFSDYQFPVFGAFYGYAGQVTVITSGVSLSIQPGGYEL